MRFVPTTALQRGYISKDWTWRHLRGIQCILHATHGLVSPNPDFFNAAFGSSYDQFLEVISMPDRYIMHRKKYSNSGALEWAALYRKMSPNQRSEFFALLDRLRDPHERSVRRQLPHPFPHLLEHYYPHGKTPPRN